MKKLFTKSTIIAFTLGLAITFGYIQGLSWIQDPCTGTNVGVVTIIGYIDVAEDPANYFISAPAIVQLIEKFDADPTMKALVLNVDSPGGLTESSESIMLALKRVSKPVVAVIHNMASSGAYLAVTGTDRIYASRMSDIGGIGVTMDFLDVSEKNRRDGIIFYDFSSAIYKGALKDNSQLTSAQREVIMEDVMKSHDIFVWDVAQNRNIPLEKVKEIATGRTYLGEDALKLDLIDQIGGLPEATMWLEDQIGEKVALCYAGV